MTSALPCESAKAPCLFISLYARAWRDDLLIFRCDAAAPLCAPPFYIICHAYVILFLLYADDREFYMRRAV